MKVFLQYEDNENTELHKTLKITLPKSWNAGPTSKLLETFVETYNSNEALGGRNPLELAHLHLSIQAAAAATTTDSISGLSTPLACDAILQDVIPDRATVFVRHGAAPTLCDLKQEQEAEILRKREALQNSVACTHFGCKNRFPRGGPYPSCQYHKSPPVFHETAKFWSCCPNKKAYDWDTFEKIPGCLTGTCTDIKESNTPQFLGGSDLREQAAEPQQLKSIDDFNKSQQCTTATATATANMSGDASVPALERLQAVLLELGMEQELFDQVVTGIQKKQKELHGDNALSEAQLAELVQAALGKELKESFKAIAAKQLRIS
jgi:hypothetical protein